MRPLTGVTLALCLAFVLPGCVESSFETIPSAGWKAGNTFAYTLAGKASYLSHASVDGQAVDDASEDTPIGPMPLFSYRVINTQATDGMDPLYVAVASGANGITGPAVMLDSDHVDYQPQLDQATLVAFRQRNLEPVTIALAGKALTTAALSGGFDTIRFPLKYGDSWDTTIGGDVSVYGGSSSSQPGVDVHSTVKGMSKIDGPYGKVDAVRIHHQFEVPGLQDAIDEARAGAQAQGIDVQQFDFTYDVSMDVFFAPSLHAIVLEALTFDIHINIEASQTEPYGPNQGRSHQFSAEAQSQGSIAIVLANVDLASAPETPLDSTVTSKIEPPALPSTDAPADTGPVGDDHSPGHLNATASAKQINAAETPSVTFTADATGTLGAVRWVLYDGAGVIVRQGEGTQFSMAFDRPGAYQASFSAYDYTSKSTLTAVVPLRADYKVDAEAVVCPPVSAGVGTVQNQCAARAVPMGAGLSKMTLSMARKPLAGEPGLGDLVVKQGGSEVARAKMNGNAATVDIDPALANDGDLEMQYVTPVGLSDSVTYSIDAAYAGNDQPAPAAAAVSMYHDQVKLMERLV
jgi:hypothetical protein